MAIVDINNGRVAVALDWHLLPGKTSEGKEIDALVKASGTKFGCTIADDEAGLTMVGLSEERRENVNCGAAWLARASARQSLVLVEPLEDDRLWLVAVRAGLPVQGLDVVIEAAQLHERLQDFLRDGGEVRLCSTLENLDQVYPNVLPQSFAELVASTKPERVKRISGVNPAIIATAAFILVVFGGWYGVDTYMQKVRQSEARAKLAQLSAQQQQRDAATVANMKRQRREAGESMIRAVVLDMPSVDTVVAAYFDEFDSKPMALAGWTLSGLDCANGACTLSWARGTTGNILGFLKAAEDKGWSVARAEGNDATTVHVVTAAPRTASIDALDPDTAFRAALETKLQEASATGIRYELGRSSPLDKLLPAAPNEKGAGKPAPVEPLPWNVGTLTVKGTQLFELRELPEYVTHAGMSVKDMRVDLKTNEWKMELSYATR